LLKIGFENADRCTQNAENCFSFDFLEQHHKDEEEYLSHIVGVTGDETWVSFVTVETKKQSKQWMHTHSPNKTKKLNKRLPAKKADGNCFLGQEGSADSGIHATRD
jgi:hypothetical protein